TGKAEIAQDITAETFFKALKSIGNFSWQGIPFSAWLYRICTNEIAAYYRKGAYRAVSMDDLISKGFRFASEYDLEEEIIAAENALERATELQLYSQAIKHLPQKYQDVITLRYFADKKLNEIADILGKPEGTIKSLLHRGIEKLKRI
ncbi:MAG TPA: RNA polymerase sigma factor, partial [Bacteroidales bacterium]|nr:RNA polymerase sigma factor [Bacteroidales bacterium]